MFGIVESLSSKAILSGRSSLISTNRRLRTLVTSLPGMGAEALDSTKAGLELEGRGIHGRGVALMSRGMAAGGGATGSRCASPGRRIRGM